MRRPDGTEKIIGCTDLQRIIFETASNKRVHFSPRWKELRGMSDEEVTDGETEWAKGIHPEDAPRVMAAVQAHFDGRSAIFSEEYRVQHKDGHWVWIHDRGIARRDPSGKVVRMAGSEIDITARKRAEQELRHSEQRYRGILTALTPSIWVTSCVRRGLRCSWERTMNKTRR